MPSQQFSIPVSQVIAGSYVKYSRLSELISFAYSGSRATHINLYIDLYAAYKALYSESFRTEMTDYTAVTSSVLNMCAHYRAFFKRLGVTTKIFLIFSYNCNAISRKLVAGYNKTFFRKSQNKIIADMVSFNNEILEILCPFLPDIHFLKTEFEVSVLIEYLIRKEQGEGNLNPNIIISKDIYPCQITSLHDDTTLIRPKKLHGEDISTIITPRNSETYIDTFWSMILLSRNYRSDSRLGIHPVNLPLFFALNKMDERDLEMLCSYGKTTNMIKNVVGEQCFKLTPVAVQDQLMLGHPPYEIVNSRYKVLDIDYQLGLFMQSMESKQIHYDNLSDNATVNMICSKYFEKNPIDLQRLG